jgi:hypothetical protein
MSPRKDYNKVKYPVLIGTESYGWIMIAEFTHHNVWERVTRSGVPIRSSFYKDEVPNENARYTVD